MYVKDVKIFNINKDVKCIMELHSEGLASV